MNSFTKEEIRVLKEFAKKQIEFEDIFLKDEKGNRIPYRNRFETWDDAYTNLKNMGMSHKDIILRIGCKIKEKNNNKGGGDGRTK